jgi:hypothetical protein
MSRFGVQNTDRVLVARGLQKPIDVGWGEGGVAPEVAAQAPLPVTLNDSPQYAAAAVGAVSVAGTLGTAFEVAKLVEHEQLIVAGSFEVTVPDALLLLTLGRADARVLIEHDASR